MRAIRGRHSKNCCNRDGAGGNTPAIGTLRRNGNPKQDAGTRPRTGTDMRAELPGTGQTETEVRPELTGHEVEPPGTVHASTRLNPQERDCEPERICGRSGPGIGQTEREVRAEPTGSGPTEIEVRPELTGHGVEPLRTTRQSAIEPQNRIASTSSAGTKKPASNAGPLRRGSVRHQSLKNCSKVIP